jgi:uncharacterized protein (TIGR02145 family)
MKTITLLLTAILTIATCSLTAQVAVTTDGSSADGSAMLEVKSTEKGFLPPRMTEAQRDAISNPGLGLMIYCIDCQEVQLFNGIAWQNMMGGDASSWSCGKNITDARDGQFYSTVEIGTQCWMAENLNVGARINGSIDQTNNSTMEKYCYDDNESNCNTYGGLYQWDEMMQYVITEGVQGICSAGWHLPTDAEWTVLTTFLGGEDIAGGKMKETGTAHWISPNTSATNSSGFTALSGGKRNTNGTLSLMGYYGYFWSSTEVFTTSVWYRNLYYLNDNAGRADYTKDYGLSVRCLRD